LALQRDGAKCKICGFDVLVEVHHIKPRRRNGGGGTNDLSNLITLCPNHHAMADRELISNEELKRYIETVAE
jgi:predicted restriction endonuclease